MFDINIQASRQIKISFSSSRNKWRDIRSFYWEKEVLEEPIKSSDKWHHDQTRKKWKLWASSGRKVKLIFLWPSDKKKVLNRLSGTQQATEVLVLVQNSRVHSDRNRTGVGRTASKWNEMFKRCASQISPPSWRRSGELELKYRVFQSGSGRVESFISISSVWTEDSEKKEKTEEGRKAGLGCGWRFPLV